CRLRVRYLPFIPSRSDTRHLARGPPGGRGDAHRVYPAGDASISAAVRNPSRCHRDRCPAYPTQVATTPRETRARHHVLGCVDGPEPSSLGIHRRWAKGAEEG